VAIPVSQEDVALALRPWLGSTFLAACPIVQGLAIKLQTHAPYRQTLEELRDEVESYIITYVNRFTGGDMRVMLDGFNAVRLSLQDIAWMADDSMGLLFDSLPPISANFHKLNDYALKVESLAAIRVLYQKYRAFYTEEQYQFLVRMIRSIHQPFRYSQWL